MKIKAAYYWIGIPLILAGMLFCWCYLSSEDERPASNQTSHRTKSRDPRARRMRRQSREARIAERRAKAGADRSVTEVRMKPTLLALEADEEAELTELGLKLLKDLQAALDAENFKEVSRLAASLQDMRTAYGTDEAIPALLRRRVIEALGWFGAAAVSDLIVYLSDTDPDVSQLALDQLMMSLDDITLGDRDRADIIKQIATVMTDDDGLDRMMMEISNMRNSVGIQTIVDIFATGTPEAVAKMPETLRFFTGEDNIATVEDAEEWYRQNPDGEYDEDLYGPM